MSPEPYPFFTISEKDSPEQIEMRIKLLIRLYLAQHETAVASAVVTHINAVLAHPHYITDVKTRCQYRRLSEHWRVLAWADGNTMQNNTVQHQAALKIELKQIQCQ